MSRQLRINVSEQVYNWIMRHATETTPSDLVENALIENYGIGTTASRSSSTEEAKKLIVDIIENKKEKEAKSQEIQGIAEMMGISKATLRRAKFLLGVRSIKYGFGADSEWYWTL